MTPNARISGTYVIEGKPLACRLVTLANGESRIAVSTDAAGAFYFEGLPAGDYRVGPYEGDEKFFKAVTIADGEVVQNVSVPVPPSEAKQD